MIKRQLSAAFVFTLLLAAIGLPTQAQNGKAKKNADETPQWIWLGQPKDGQTVYFRHVFEVTGKLAAKNGALLTASCDNQLTVFINGKQVGKSNEWNEPVRVDVTAELKTGKNIIAIEGKNDGGIAAMVAMLKLTTADKETTTIVSDTSWLASDKGAANWNALDFDAKGFAAATTIAKLGAGPWGNVFTGAAASDGGRAVTAGSATPADSLKLLPGFKAELIHSVPKGEQGSWVNLCVDHKGRLIASNQNGMLYRITVDSPSKGEVKIEPIEVYIMENDKDGKPQRKGQPIGKAHGLCWAFDSLYVVICDGGGIGNGLYRLRDTNNDDQLDHAELLMALQGGGEHGPHAIKLGPDGYLWVMAGNHTNPPKGLLATSPVKNFAEDQLLPRNPDGNGHATGRMAPGGWICKIDKDGKEWSMHSSGFRNQFDYDWNSDGEIFTYDADMEYDTGVPWFRPTRVNHCISGAEFGWRYGTGKWPEYYADSFGAVINIGRGCPTGVTAGTGAKFPVKYQKAIYILDWTFGKLYAIHLQPSGASYTATSEVFVEGKPLPLTDAIVGADGALYFTIGGRGTQSGLYRVTYEGDESTALASKGENPIGKEDRALRRKLESFHGKQDAAAVEFAWPHLNSSDRAIRYAARIAIEWQEPSTWLSKAFEETKPSAVITSMLAVARTNDKALLGKAIASLNKLNLARLTEEQQLDALRAYGLCFIRLGGELTKQHSAGEPDAALAAAVAKKIAPLFPGNSELVNREAASLLIYLSDAKIVSKAIAHMSNLVTQEDQFYYAYVLRAAKAGWTPALRTAHFSWMNLASSKYSGGNSFKKFIEQARRDAQATMTDEEKTSLAAVIKGETSVDVVKDTKPRQYVHNWQMDDLMPIINQATSGRNFQRGKEAFEAAQCAKCHLFGGEGGSTGPDLSTIGNRFSPADLLEAIVLPSKVVSDQYAPTEIETKDGEYLVGKIMKEDEKSVSLMTNPFGGDETVILKKDIEKRGLSKTSLMPSGLVTILQKDEVLDMIAYMRSGANKDDKAFQK